MVPEGPLGAKKKSLACRQELLHSSCCSSQFCAWHSPAFAPSMHSCGMSDVQPTGAIQGQSGTPEGCFCPNDFAFLISESRGTDGS